MISDLIYENYYKINLWYCKQSTLTQSRIFHRRHMVSMIQSAVTSQHQKQTFFLPWEHGMVAEQNHYLPTQPTTRTNEIITTWWGNHMETRSGCFEMIGAGKTILMSQLESSIVWSISTCGGGGWIFGNVLPACRIMRHATKFVYLLGFLYFCMGYLKYRIIISASA